MPALGSRGITSLSPISLSLHPFSLSLSGFLSSPQDCFKVSVRRGLIRYFLNGRRNGKLPAPLYHQHQYRLSPRWVPDDRCLHRRSCRSDDAPCGPSLLVSINPLSPCWTHTRSSTTTGIRVLCLYLGISGFFRDGKTLYWTSDHLSSLHRARSWSALRLRRCFLRSEGVAESPAKREKLNSCCGLLFACRRAHYCHVEATAFVLLLLVDFLTHSACLHVPPGRVSSW